MPVIGVIEPGVRALVAATATGRVGVIGTVGTIASGAYQRAVAADAAPPVELTCAACPGFVEFVERGETGSDQVHVLAERLLAPVRDAEVDTLLLGCTHYPYLARTIATSWGATSCSCRRPTRPRSRCGALLRRHRPASAPRRRQGRAPLPLVGRRRLVPRARRPAARPRARRAWSRDVGTDRHRARLRRLATPGPAARAAATSSGRRARTVWLDAGSGHAGQPPAPRRARPTSTPSCSPTSTPTTGIDLDRRLRTRCSTATSRDGRAGVRHAGGARAGSTSSSRRRGADVRLDDDRRRRRRRRSAACGFAFTRTDHPVETLAVRVDAGGRVARVLGRHRPGWSFAALGDGIDLALCEATLADRTRRARCRT